MAASDVFTLSNDELLSILKSNSVKRKIPIKEEGNKTEYYYIFKIGHYHYCVNTYEYTAGRYLGLIEAKHCSAFGRVTCEKVNYPKWAQEYKKTFVKINKGGPRAV